MDPTTQKLISELENMIQSLKKEKDLAEQIIAKQEVLIAAQDELIKNLVGRSDY